MHGCFLWFQPWIRMAIVSLFETITLSASSSSRISDACHAPISPFHPAGASPRSTRTSSGFIGPQRQAHLPSHPTHPHTRGSTTQAHLFANCTQAHFTREALRISPNPASSARHASTPRRTCTYPQVMVAYSSCLRSLLPANTARMEDSPSGLWRTLGKRVGVTASRVRISYPPPSPFSHPKEKGFFISVEPRRRMAGIGRHKPLPPARNTIRPPAPHGENTQASAKR